MKFTSTAAALALVGAVVAQQTSGDITVNTPASLVQCQPAQLSWSGGKAPYIVAIIPGGQASAAAIATVDDQAQGTSETWTVNIPAGQSVSIKLTDADGKIQYSSPLDVQSGSSSACLAAGASSGAASGSASATSGAASSSAASASASSAAASSAAMSSAAMSSAASASSATSAAASSATSRAASASGNAASSVTSAAGAATSAAGGSSGAMANTVGIPAVILGAMGAIAALF
ncbi:hypothetical protein IAU60_003439 [Kwoniella sp. DSM 27419]